MFVAHLARDPSSPKARLLGCCSWRIVTIAHLSGCTHRAPLAVTSDASRKGNPTGVVVQGGLPGSRFAGYVWQISGPNQCGGGGSGPPKRISKLLEGPPKTAGITPCRCLRIPLLEFRIGS